MKEPQKDTKHAKSCVYLKSVVNVILKGKTLEAFLLIIRRKNKQLAHFLLFKIIL